MCIKISRKIDFDSLICKKFGYKKTSCKQAYFAVNETINYYISGVSTIHLASLDATKAFDKLWRDGLFFKLKDKINSCLWRIIVSYYNNSKIIVKMGAEKSEAYRTTEGVKQGGVLSPYLFNFFIDEMITSGLAKNTGAKLGKNNVSVVSYCDDILLLGCTTTQSEILLDNCQEYAMDWKMEFNPKKSVYMEIGKYKNKNIIKMSGIRIPEVSDFIYLGLPIGDTLAINSFLEKKMSKVERAFYSLYGIGCKPHALNPKTIAFLYKQFCQSIFRYGLDNLFVNNNQLLNFNTRQNILIKRALGLSKFCKTTPLFQVLKVESMKQLYYKHKIFMYKQVVNNTVSSEIFFFLKDYYDGIKAVDSLIKQLKEVEVSTKTEDSLSDLKKTMKKIEGLNICQNKGLLDSIDFNTKMTNYIEQKNLMESFLRYKNFVDK